VQKIEAQKAEENFNPILPNKREIGKFARESVNLLKDLSFELKREIVMSVVQKIGATPDHLEVKGCIPITNHVESRSSHWHRRPPERGEIDSF
jgi:hypothetical protein